MKIKTTTYPICAKTGERKPPQKHRTIETTEDKLLLVMSEKELIELLRDGSVWIEFNLPNVLHYFELYEIVEV